MKGRGGHQVSHYTCSSFNRSDTRNTDVTSEN